jgi:hypothetical protein
MPLPNLHALRTEDIIRRHEMKVEIRNSVVKRVVYPSH